jgi:MFS transporter, DHA1 family, multidrug resistance protein
MVCHFYVIITILGALSVVSPFAIDMYLPAYPQVAKDFGVESTVISLTISSYFIGLAGGQVLYGPLLDRFGRKKPLCAGLALFILASVGCAASTDIRALGAFRFIQAIGGCSAGVSSLAMVRDFFPVDQSAKILSLLFLFIAASPLLAPSTGGFIAIYFGWRVVFYALMAIAGVILVLVWSILPEAHAPDPTISLKPLPILREYFAIMKRPRFATYALAGGFSFAGLFTYVAGSPVVFMEGFHLSPQIYSLIFAGLSVGFIGGSQLNVILLRKFDSKILFAIILAFQAVTGLVFITGTWLGWFGLARTLVLFFIFLACAGVTYPNAAALALAPFSKNAGSAAALLGFLQLGVGAFISSAISVSTAHDSLPIIALLAVTATFGLIVLMIGGKRAATDVALD